MEMKQMAQRTLKAIADNYQRLVERERLEQETRLIDETEASDRRFCGRPEPQDTYRRIYRWMVENEEKSVWTK